jgi:Fe2+ or Zn2+ uptake regulation protein
MNNETIGQFLLSYGVKPSHHRIQVLRYLLENRNHPTVDTIFQALRSDIPTLSKTTLYNTLNLFVEKKIASLITIEENEARYDADTSLHGHFKCIECGRIFDIKLQLPDLAFAELDNFEVFETQLYFQGICPQCGKINH